MVVVGGGAELGVGAGQQAVGLVVAVGCCLAAYGEGGAVAVFVGATVVSARAAGWRAVAVIVGIVVYCCSG